MDIHNIILEDSNGHPLKAVGPNGEAVAPLELPKSGALTSYELYDDGAYQDGNAISPRFVDMGKNEILDRATSLVWIKRPELIIPTGLNSDDVGVEQGDYQQAVRYNAGDIVTDPSNSNAYICLTTYTTVEVDFPTELAGANAGNWQQTEWATSNNSGGVSPTYVPWDRDYGSTPNNALDMCQRMTKGGLAAGTWRLPNVKQLVSIVDYEHVSPAINTTFFPNCVADAYWTSTIYADDTYYAWYVSCYDGNVGGDSRNYSSLVRPVRQY